MNARRLAPRRLLLGAAMALALSAAGVAAWIAWPLPPALLAPAHRSAVTLTDRRGLPLRSTRAADGSLARWVPLAEMDPDLIAAFLAAEDRRFYEHGALDLRAVARAAWANLRAGRVVSGASTVTMQLARLVQPSPRTWSGKLQQALWALRLESHLGKQAILEQYLNRVPLGQATVGVESAVTLYAGGTATDVSLGQAAMLAGLARAPSSDNPIVSPARARARRALVLRRLVERGYASAPAAERARAEPLLTRSAAAFLAPHFTTRLLQWAEDSAPGVSGIWRTSLDLALQERLESEVRHTVELLRSQGVQHAAAVVLDNASGEILAWVGSPDFWADTAGQVDMVSSPRQPGSALKPFLYGLAFDRGYTPAAVLPDLPQVYQTGTGPYSPRNYDRRFHGPVRAREALASSFNLPAVELANRLSVASLLATLHQAGFTSLTRSAEYYGLGLALGNGDVTLLDLANGYRALVNGGRWRPYRWRPALADERGEPGRRVMSPLAAALVLDVLSDPVARLPGFGLETPFDFPFPVAVKTGTSRHFTDNWAVGVTGGFTVAVWVGNFNGRPMDGVSGVSGAGPLLHRAVLATGERYAAGVLPSPREQGAVPVLICRVSGMLAGEHCPTMTEWVQPDLVPSRRCDWHGSDGLHMPAEYAEWASAAAGPATPVVQFTAAAVPSDSAGRFRIVAPRDGDRYDVPPGVDPRYATLALRAGGAGAVGVRWYVDGRAVRGTRWPLAPGAHRIRAEGVGGVRDEVGIEVR